eukprot:1582275-Rhodomonas_salina.1
MMWVKLLSSIENQRLFGFSNAPPNYDDNFGLSFSTASNLPKIHYRSGEEVQLVHDSDDSVALNTWTHVVLTFADTTKQFKLYLDGVLVETSVEGTGPFPHIPRSLSFLGRDSYLQNLFSDMQISDFRWYQRTLNDTEVGNAFSGVDTYAEDVYALAGLNCSQTTCTEVFDICPAAQSTETTTTCDLHEFETVGPYCIINCPPNMQPAGEHVAVCEPCPPNTVRPNNSTADFCRPCPVGFVADYHNFEFPTCREVYIKHSSRGLMAAENRMYALSVTGELIGYGSTYPPPGGAGNAFALPASVMQFGMGWGVNFALTADNEVYCWGGNTRAECGLDSETAVISSPTKVKLPALGANEKIVALAGASCGACVLLSDNGMYCWGRSDLGQATYGQDSNDDLGDSNGEMAALTRKYLGTANASIVQVVGCEQTFLALRTDNTVFVWGYYFAQSDGVTGYFHEFLLPKAPEYLVCSYPKSGRFCAKWRTGGFGCWGPSSAVNTKLPGAILPENAQDLPIASNTVSLEPNVFSFAHVTILDSGDIVAWGDNAGIPGGASTTSQNLRSAMTSAGLGDAVSVAAYRDTHLCVLDVAGKIACLGGSYAGVPTTPDPLSTCDESGIGSCNIVSGTCPVFSEPSHECACYDGYANAFSYSVAAVSSGSCMPCPAAHACANGTATPCDMIVCVEQGVPLGPYRSCPFNHNIQTVSSCACPEVLIERCMPCPWNMWCPAAEEVYACPNPQAIPTCNNSSEYLQCGQCHSCGNGTLPLDSLPFCDPANPPVCDGITTCRTVCNLGEYTPNKITCEPCTTGVTFCADGVHATTCSTVCADGQTPSSACNQTHDMLCGPCPADSWCAGGVTNACPTNSVSLAGSDIQQDCLCKPGYYGTVGGLCQECTVDYWCPGGGGIFKCPNNSSSLHMAANSSSDCFCDAGFEQVNFTIAEGPVCAKTGPATCPDENMRSHSGLLVDCTCRPGYYALNATTCAYCPEDHYCLGGEHIAACHSNSLTPMGSNHSRACTCDRGYYEPGPSNCTMCPANSWCWGGVKNDCPEGLVSEPGLSWPENCTCTSSQFAVNPQTPQFHTNNERACVLVSGKVWCWGYDDNYGLIGTGRTGDGYWWDMSLQSEGWDVTSAMHVNDLALGYQHTCMIVGGIHVACIGANSHGQLGYSDTIPRFTAPYIGANLVYVDIGTGVTASDVVAGGDTTCVVVNAMTALKCWGANAKGQLGYGDTATRGAAQATMGDSLPSVDLGMIVPGERIIDVDTNYAVTCVLIETESATVRGQCWGTNEWAQVKPDTTYTAATFFTTPQPPLDFGTGFTPAKLAISNQVSCALSNDAQVKCWGNNKVGILGFSASGKYPLNGDAHSAFPQLATFISVSHRDPNGNHAVAIVATNNV